MVSKRGTLWVTIKGKLRQNFRNLPLDNLCYNLFKSICRVTVKGSRKCFIQNL